MRERRHLAEAGGDVSAHPLWRDPTTALMATERIVGIARDAGKRVHVLHITTAEEVRFLSRNKDIASLEVTPQHLTLAAPECYETLGSKAQMNPPIRDAAEQAGLWWGVQQGVVDVIGSDHAPHTLDEKAKAYPDSPSGMPGVQTLVPILLDHVAAGRLTLQRFVDLTSAGAQRLFATQCKGRMAVGYDGDLTLADLSAEMVIDDSQMATKSGWTPFHGRRVTGWPVATIIRGRIVMRDGELAERATGQAISFLG